MPQNNSSNVQTEAVSKPRTIIRMLSSKFTPRPPPPTVELSKDQRDAALRARGLLPQQPAQPPDQKSDEGLPSAADLVKKEWAAKNHILERERINAFKFGGPLNQTATQKQLPSLPSSPSPVEIEVSPEMFPSPPPSATLSTSHSGEPVGTSSSGVQAPSLSPPAIALTPPITKSNDTASTDGMALDAGFHLRMDSFAKLEASISSVATPAVDSSSQITESLPSLASVGEGAKSKAPNSALGRLGDLQLKAYEGALVPVIVESPVDFHFSEDLAVVVEESTSLAEVGLVMVDEDKDKDKVDDHGKEETRVIPLTPLRRTVAAISTATPTATPTSPQRCPTITAPKPPTATGASADTGASRTQKRGMTDPTPVSVAEGKRKIMNPFRRGQTLAGEHNKDNVSTAKAVDDTAIGVVVGDEKGKAEPRPRRLTMGSSLSNLRRSFVGTLSRPSNSGGANASSKKFNASHLPPSPTIPSSFNIGSPGSPIGTARSRSRGGSGGSGNNEGGQGATPIPTPRMYQPIAMHNHGTIQSETAAIEDDETRRMTELAFLG